jgi:hypothetical protein
MRGATTERARRPVTEEVSRPQASVAYHRPAGGERSRPGPQPATRREGSDQVVLVSTKRVERRQFGFGQAEDLT